MIRINYVNGSFDRVDKVSLKDVEQVGNAIIMASKEGWHYRGKPKDMARDATCHINKQLGFEIGVFFVILSNKVNAEGYTSEIVFQAVA